MSSRMDKYENNISYDSLSRTKRNEHIYNSTDMNELSRIKTNNNVSIISDGGKTVNLEKIKSYIDSINNNDEDERKKISIDIPEKEELVIVRKEEKDYDINAVLEKAKENQETDYEENRHRKINNTQIDILKSIKIKNTKKSEDLTPSVDELNTEEKTIVDLIQNIQNNSSNAKKESKNDLFEDLMGEDDDTVVMGAKDNGNIKEELLSMTQDLENIKLPENDFTQEINIEIEKLKSKDNEEDDSDNTDEIKQDDSFYTNSVSFDKSDFEGFEDLEDTAKKSSMLTKIAIVLVLLLLLGTIFIIVNYVFDLNLI
ncbi:MAG: hypothetical protein PUA90_05010 [bacterium]|nr:hypothetical protein [bacterium]